MKFISTILAHFNGLVTKLNPVLQKLYALKDIPAVQKAIEIISSSAIGKLSSPVKHAIFIAVAIFIIVIMLLNQFTFGTEDRIKLALDSGQRIEISLETGEITGNIEKQDKNEIAKKAEDETKEDSQAGEQSGELAWINEDYIGPRLPDNLLSIMLGESVRKKQLAIDSVSIKDISEKPVVVIIIKGLGLSSSSTREALQLPKEITMGYSPYSPSLDMWVKKTKASGHEIVLNIPMETSSFKTNNPGPYSLLTQSSDEDNSTRLKMLLNLTSEYDAVYSENTEVFTRSLDSIRPVLETLGGEGRYFVYGGGYSNYSMIQIANSLNYPVLVNDLVLDDDISSSAINKKFTELEKIANDKGYVVVMAHPYPMTIRMLQAWLPKAKEKGLAVSPVSLLLGKVFKE